MPNLGRVLTQKLKLVGINTPDILIEMGAENAFLRLKTVENDACFSMLCALEGAIKDIRWHYIDSHRKSELRDFYTLTKNKRITSLTE